MENFEGLVLGLLRSSISASDDPASNSWQARLMEIVQETISQIVSAILQENTSEHPSRSKRSFQLNDIKLILQNVLGFESHPEERGEPTSGRHKRGLKMNDLHLLLDHLFPGVIEPTSLLLEIFQEEDIVQRLEWKIQGSEIGKQIRKFLEEWVKVATDTILKGEVSFAIPVYNFLKIFILFYFFIYFMSESNLHFPYFLVLKVNTNIFEYQK